MKQNISIVATYGIGFVLLNMGVLLYAVIRPEIIVDEELFTQVSIFANIAFYFVTATVLIILFRKYFFEQVRDFLNRLPRIGLIIILGLVGIYTISTMLAVILSLIGVVDEAANQQSILDMIDASGPLQLIMIISFITILAPVVEELVFRKGVYGIIGLLTMNSIMKHNLEQDQKKPLLISNIVAIAISSLAFGAIHAFDWYLLLYGGLGAVLGTVYYLSNKNIFASIGVHILYNSISIIITLFVL